MATLAERIRTAREEWVTVGGHEYLLRRPTKLQLAEFFSREERPWVEVVFIAVVGWKMQEKDLVPGGGGRDAPFEADAFREYASDDDALMVELARCVKEMIDRREAQLEGVEKN